jgi:peptidoglycan L-alanyl-D-glutamate endopeptidase CwlK
MAERRIEVLSPTMQVKVNQWCARMDEADIDYLITCTKRTTEEQSALYAQGRTTPGKIVTWTMNSKHLTGEAFDFVIMFSGKPDWQMKHMDLWNMAVKIGKELGLVQVIGKNGKVLEYAHLQETHP